MMDSTGNDDGDIKLQRASADLISQLEISLSRFLWKSTGSVRRLVREPKATQLIRLVGLYYVLLYTRVCPLMLISL